MKVKEFEQEFVAATGRGKRLLRHLPKATAARYDRKSKRLVLELQNGTTLLVPTNLIQGLSGKEDHAVADLKLVSEGTQIHWPAIDVQLHVKSLIDGVFGTARWMERLKQHYSSIGRRGGRARTSAKAAASRQNGRRGGRPRKLGRTAN